MVGDKWKKLVVKIEVLKTEKTVFLVQVNFRIICYGNGVKSN